MMKKKQGAGVRIQGSGESGSAVRAHTETQRRAPKEKNKALPTIKTAMVIKKKPKGDHKNYITPEELAELVVDFILRASPYINGSVVGLLKYSSSFYNQAYFDRNPSKRSQCFQEK